MAEASGGNLESQLRQKEETHCTVLVLTLN